MAATLKEARLLAYINNEKTLLTIDLDARRWGIQGRRNREIPPEVQIRIIDPVHGELIKGIHNLAFFPTGRVDGKNIILQEGKKEWQLLTDPVVGAVLIKGQ